MVPGADAQDCPRGDPSCIEENFGADDVSRGVQNNHTALVEFSGQPEEGPRGIDPLSTSNTVIAKAAPSTGILPFCVGVSKEPPRVRIFQDRLTCNESIWSTLFTFTAHTKQDDYLTSTPLCVGFSPEDHRSLLIPSSPYSGTCNSGQWKPDFFFYESANVFSSVQVWQALQPPRTLMYPGYRGQYSEFTLLHTLTTRTQFRPSIDLETRSFKSDYVNHIEVHKQLRISAIPDANTMRCVTTMIENSLHLLTTNSSVVSTFQAGDAPVYAAKAFDAKCSSLVLSSTIKVKRVEFGKLVSVEVNIGENTYAAISIRPELIVFPFFARLALHESMRTGEPVMVSKNDKYEPEQGIVAYFQESAFTMGGGDIWLGIN
ncbi:hypothetical protein BGW39_000823 [Mortierella sp. 14UC]|nr:hypothetical protein BGW39_000823 [Mortierella sp. 14UC]